MTKNEARKSNLSAKVNLVSIFSLVHNIYINNCFRVNC